MRKSVFALATAGVVALVATPATARAQSSPFGTNFTQDLVWAYIFLGSALANPDLDSTAQTQLQAAQADLVTAFNAVVNDDDATAATALLDAINAVLMSGLIDFGELSQALTGGQEIMFPVTVSDQNAWYALWFLAYAAFDFFDDNGDDDGDGDDDGPNNNKGKGPRSNDRNGDGNGNNGKNTDH